MKITNKKKNERKLNAIRLGIIVQYMPVTLEKIMSDVQTKGNFTFEPIKIDKNETH